MSMSKHVAWIFVLFAVAASASVAAGWPVWVALFYAFLAGVVLGDHIGRCTN